MPCSQAAALGGAWESRTRVGRSWEGRRSGSDGLLPTVIGLLRYLRESVLRRRHLAALRKIRVIEAMDLPEDLKRAAVNRVLRRFEERLDRFTRGT